MRELKKEATNILSTSGWAILEVAVILAIALLIAQIMDLEQTSLEVQYRVVVAIALVGGTGLELVRRHFIAGLVRRIVNRVRYRDILVPELSKQFSDLELLFVAQENQEHVKELAILVAKRLRADAKGKSIRGIAVLPAEKERLVHYYPFWYMIAEELDILTKARFDWIEPVDMRVGLYSSIGRLNKSDYVAVWRLASLNDELERKVPEWLEKSTGAKVGPIRYVTVAKSSQPV